MRFSRTSLILPSSVLALLCFSACSAPAPSDSTGGDGDGDGDSSVPSDPLKGSGGNGLIGEEDVLVETKDPNDIDNPCEAEDAPEECELFAPPACGDGEINLDPPEACDDGNSKPGDGCSGACIIEPFHVCPTPGVLCDTTIVCGDGEVGPGEACDDANTNDGDGCTSTCSAIEPGYSCRLVGEPCFRVYLCGDGTVDSNEGCDDGARENGDGCDDRCRFEEGFKCEGNPSVCTPTTCGDAIIEGAESCDDGNAVPFDGCSPTCKAEPVCVTGQACSSSCGDGITLNDEQCDDGNLRSGDGCSDSCQTEEGYECSQPEGCEGDDCILELPIVYRDFTIKHADFGLDPDNLDDCSSITRGVARDLLDANGKPELAGTTNSDACIDTAASYADWYTDVPSNAEIVDSISLYADGKGGYVNRFGENGEPYVATVDTGNEQGGYGNSEAQCASTCTTRTGDSLQCVNVCRPEHDAIDQRGRELTQAQQQLNQPMTQLAPLLADREDLTDALALAEAADPPDAAEIADLEADIAALNVTIAPLQATVDGIEADIAALEAQVATLTTVADACDVDCQTLFTQREAECTANCTPCSFNPAQWCIGGEIVEFDGNPLFFPVEESMGSAADLDVALIPDEVYGGKWSEDPSGEMRNYFFTSEIAYWFEYTDGMTAELSFVGDDDMWVYVNGQLAVDLGGLHVPVEGRFTLNANGTINQLHGTDGTPDENEPGSSTAAAFGLEPGNVYEVKVFQAERKMWGSSYKLTLSGFSAGASDCVTDCGDGEVGPGEECDDGVGNTGGYNACTADCTFGPRCGDGVLQDEEICDLGDSLNSGEYGGCSPTCALGPYCGDGIATNDEECDDGENLGTYGGCAAGCVAGPICGDGGWEPMYEDCDDGNNDDNDGCSGACKIEEVKIK